MGKLVYGRDAGFDVEDRQLAHVRIVHMTKMRRGEPFMFQLPDQHRIGMRSLWMAPAVSVEYRFFGSRQPALNVPWLDAMMKEANGPHGLTLGPEPAA
jgi:hypothetical protein